MSNNVDIWRREGEDTRPLSSDARGEEEHTTIQIKLVSSKSANDFSSITLQRMELSAPHPKQNPGPVTPLLPSVFLSPSPLLKPPLSV